MTTSPRVLSPRGLTTVCIGVAAAAIVLVVMTGMTAETNRLAHPATFVVLTALLTYTHVRPTRLVHRHGAVESDHLDDALFAPMALALPPFQFAAAVALASLTGNLSARRAPVKMAFNVGQTVLASLAGLAVARAAGVAPDAPLSAAALTGSFAGGMVFAAISSLAVAVILRLASGQPVLAGLRSQWSARSLASLGSLLLGVVCAAAIRAYPLAAVPSVVLCWIVAQAYAATVVQRQARYAAEALQVAIVSIRNSSDPEHVRAQVLTAARDVLHARAASFVPASQPPARGELRAPVDPVESLTVSDRVGGGTWLDSERDGLSTLASVAAEALRNARLVAQLQAITDGQTEVVLAINADGVVTFANPAARRLLAASGEDEIVGQLAADVFALERPGGHVDLSAVGGAHGNVRDDDAVLWAGEKRIPVAFTVAGLPAPQTGTVLVLHDITERKAFEEQLAYLAFHDPLTKLPNRRLFEDRLDHALTRAARRASRHALIVFDLDRFKLVNDSYGHPTGDALLCHVAALLRRTLREEDTCARLGGDEFAVLLEDIENDGAPAEVAERLLAALTEGTAIDGHELFVAASIGIATSEQVGSREEFVAAADAAAYAAKAAGKGCYRRFAPNTVEEARSRLELEAAMRRGLELGEFELYYQPVVDTVTGVFVGAEALVRWNSPGGVIPPYKFIPLAEETGFIVPLGSWVLEEACRQTQVWTRAQPDLAPLKVSVNLSGHQFNRPHIVEEVADILARTGLRAEQLCLEITETVVMTDADSTIATLRSLKQLGVSVAIDDFGTGYSSLSYLKRFPVDVVKIDRAFTSGLGEDKVDSEIVAAVVRLAAACGILTVAEGVETAEQRQALADLGCPIIQGYLIAKPLQVPGFTALWSETSRVRPAAA